MQLQKIRQDIADTIIYLLTDEDEFKTLQEKMTQSHKVITSFKDKNHEREQILFNTIQLKKHTINLRVSKRDILKTVEILNEKYNRNGYYLDFEGLLDYYDLSDKEDIQLLKCIIHIQQKLNELYEDDKLTKNNILLIKSENVPLYKLQICLLSLTAFSNHDNVQNPDLQIVYFIKYNKEQPKLIVFEKGIAYIYNYKTVDHLYELIVNNLS